MSRIDLNIGRRRNRSIWFLLQYFQHSILDISENEEYTSVK